jgi:predicted dehydrogenase
MPGAVVSAVADPDPAARMRAQRIARHAVLLDDALELVRRADVDAVVVTTPPSTHAGLALAVLDAGKHLYLEKPVAVTNEEADRLAEAAGVDGLAVTVGFNRRFHPVVVEAARLIPVELGRVARVRGTFEEPLSAGALPAWKQTRATGGGAPLDLASHHADLVRHLLGVSLTPVSAELRSVRSELDDCTLRFDADGCDVHLECSFVRGRRDVLELTDDAGRTLTLDRCAGALTLDGHRVRSRALALARVRVVARPLADQSYGPSLGAWVARIRGTPSRARQGAPATIADGLASARAILSAEQLAASTAG